MAQDVVDVIMQDHREFERLFDVLRTEPAKRANTVPVLTTLLTAHSRAEEAEVYPVVRDEAGAPEHVEHSQEEHLQADKLLAKLADTDPSAPDFDSVLAELVKSVTHHLEEEESTVLPDMRQRLTEQRRAQLAEAFLASRAEHLGEEPDAIRKKELEQQAANIGLSGAADLDKGDLAEKLSRRAQS